MLCNSSLSRAAVSCSTQLIQMYTLSSHSLTCLEKLPSSCLRRFKVHSRIFTSVVLANTEVPACTLCQSAVGVASNASFLSSRWGKHYRAGMDVDMHTPVLATAEALRMSSNGRRFSPRVFSRANTPAAVSYAQERRRSPCLAKTRTS